MVAAQLDLIQFETPSMPKLDVSRCYARLINYETAANMVKKYHYAHRVPSIVVSIGMYVDDVLAGCITYGIPPVPNVQRCCGEQYRKNTLELNRLFIHDWAGYNSESWLIGQSFRLLRQEWSNYFILVSYADTGEGHEGYIYRATNWLYTGTSEPNIDIRLPDAKYHPRTTQHKGGSALVRKAGGVEVKRTLKRRYIYFLGSKSQCKKLRRALRWPVLPYPKG